MHEKYEIMISEYLDDELNGAEERELMLHLETCPDCAEHLAFVKKLSESLPKVSEEPSPDFADKLMGRLAEPFEEIIPEKKFIKFLNKNSLALAACLFLVVISALFASTRMDINKKSAARAAPPQAVADEAVEENKDKMSAFGYAKEAEAAGAAEEGAFELSLADALNEIAAENPLFKLYDSSGNCIFEEASGVKFIDELPLKTYETEKKETFKPDFEIVFGAENSGLRLNIYIEDKSFYIYSEDFDTAFCADMSFYELMSEIFGLNLSS